MPPLRETVRVQLLLLNICALVSDYLKGMHFVAEVKRMGRFDFFTCIWYVSKCYLLRNQLFVALANFGAMKEVWLQNWTDDYLRWKPSRWGGICRLHISTDKIWVSEAAFFNCKFKLLEFEKFVI